MQKFSSRMYQINKSVIAICNQNNMSFYTKLLIIRSEQIEQKYFKWHNFTLIAQTIYKKNSHIFVVGTSLIIRIHRKINT